jgi:NAD(P)-dependent dehydrogenase (short-subunit alcohol dehydrogenase family)
MTSLEGAVVLVTGGTRGLGKAVVDDLLTRGVTKVYATARKPESSTDRRVVPLQLETTDQALVDALPAAAPDVTVLINNAGIDTSSRSYLDTPVDDLRRTMEVNYFGTLAVTRAVVPVIEQNGGGHILTMLSAMSWAAYGGGYSASKAALWLQTNGLRLELLDRGIGVTGLYMGYVDTDMTAGVSSARQGRPVTGPHRSLPPTEAVTPGHGRRDRDSFGRVRACVPRSSRARASRLDHAR